jgi:hypothetical protein
MTLPSPTLQPSAAPASFPRKNVQPAMIAARTSRIPVPALNPVGANPRLAILAKPDGSSVVPWLLITIKERMLCSEDLHVGFMTTTPATEISWSEQVHRICDFSYPNDPDPSPLTLESRFRATLEPPPSTPSIFASLLTEKGDIPCKSAVACANRRVVIQVLRASKISTSSMLDIEKCAVIPVSRNSFLISMQYR